MSSTSQPDLLQALASVEKAMADGGPFAIEMLHLGAAIVDPAKRLEFYAECHAVSPPVSLYEEAPVDPQTFVESPNYLNKKNSLWPLVMREYVELNSGAYDTAVLTGGIGVAKTTIAIFTQAYQLYLLSCMRNPHDTFDLISTDEIAMVFQSRTKDLAKTVDYTRFRGLIEASPYFNDMFPYNRELVSEMKFPKHIVVKPVSGSDTAAIGQNVIGGLIDEVNFMDVIADSKQSRAQDGGSYDQAQALYNAIARRRESRFLVPGGRLPGLLCLLSSKQYPGEFTERMINGARAELERTGKTYIFVYDKRKWDVRPDLFANSKWFQVFVGDDTRRPYIVEDNAKVAVDDQPLVIDVPDDYRRSFEDDLLSALRDIAGVSTQALHPFMPNIDKVSACFDSKRWPSILTREWCDFQDYGLAIEPDNIVMPQEPRWLHIDLGLVSDSAGLSCGFVPRFVDVDRDVERETMPVIRFDFELAVRPPRNGEISFEKIRSLIYKLRELGMNIRWASMDSWQSFDMMQILKQKGLVVGLQSIDTSLEPYHFLKSALYDGRVEAPDHERARSELTRLEWNVVRKMIDHPPRGSKDVADTMAGVVYGLTMRRSIWARHKVAARIPPRLMQKVAQDDTAVPVRHEQEPRPNVAGAKGRGRLVQYGK